MGEDAHPPDLSRAQAAAEAVRGALMLRSQWTAELEAAWAEWSRDFPHVDESTMQRLRAAFEAGYGDKRGVPLVILIPDSRGTRPAPPAAGSASAP